MLKKVFVLLAIAVIGLLLGQFYFSDSDKVTDMGPEPDFSKVQPIQISGVTVFKGGKKVGSFDRGNSDFRKLEEGLQTPITYSGLYYMLPDGRHGMRLPSLYFPKIDDLIEGKAERHENATVIVVDLAKPMDMSFIEIDGSEVPREFNKLIFLPKDSDYKKVIVFSNNDRIVLTIPTKPYKASLFSDFL